MLPCDTGAAGCAQRQVNVKEAGKEIWTKRCKQCTCRILGEHQGHMCCTGSPWLLFQLFAGVQEHKNALIISAGEISVPSDSKWSSACSKIIQVRWELSCVPVDPETGASPRHSEVLPSSPSLGLWSRSGIGKPTTPKAAGAPGHQEFSAVLVLPRSPAAWWVMGFLIIPNKYKPGG